MNFCVGDRISALPQSDVYPQGSSGLNFGEEVVHSCGVSAFRRLGSYVYLGASLKFTVATTFNTPIERFIESSVKNYTECSAEKSNC
jgi:hypothetical protein